MYSTGKASYGFIAKLFNVSRTAVLKWIRNIGGKIAEPKIDGELKYYGLKIHRLDCE